MIRLIFASLIAVTLAAPAFAQDKKEIEKIIEQYIRSHPEVLDETMQNYYMKKRADEQERVFQESLKTRFELPLGDSPVKGPREAPVVFTEFSDFQCPYCARAVDMLRHLEAKYQGRVKFVFKQFPLERIHPQARPAARASMAAQAQGKFWEYHDLLMAKQNEWAQGDAQAKFAEYAKSLGLDVERFKKDMARPEYDKRIDDEMALGMKSGVQGTPTFYANGTLLRGARGVEDITRVIDALLAEKTKKN
ncbi:MAG: DsbA family protein [Nitrospinae bacterium]|nr:DsbA family protein [Nitrospinota bacterium]